METEQIELVAEETLTYTEKIFEKLVNYAPKLAAALLVLIVGMFIVKILTVILGKTMERSKLDTTLKAFLKSIIGGLLKILLFITVASMLGIQMASFVAIIGAASLAIGLALQGSLSNFAGGVLILIFRPFRVGDHIDIQGFSGIVADIEILYTVIDTMDNKRITIPNGGLANSSVVNYSKNETRRLDLSFKIEGEKDVKKVREVLTKTIKTCKNIINDKEVTIEVIAHSEAFFNVITKSWVKSSEYDDAKFSVLESVKNEFEKNEIKITSI